MKFYVKLGKVPSSITVKNKELALWYMLYANTVLDDRNFAAIQETIRTFIYSCVKLWPYKTAKGLSEFISECMMKSILEKKDFIRHRNLIKVLDKAEINSTGLLKEDEDE